MQLRTGEVGKRKLLFRIAEFNDKGIEPTKNQVIGDVSTSTRCDGYRLINALILRGLVVNTGKMKQGYSLLVTSVGRLEIAEWRAKIAAS